jgi:glycosyltransferase involved in cell wall biosynthesis
MSLMRVGFFSPTINRIGGGEWVTLNMIYAAETRKHTVLVCSAEKVHVQQLLEFYGAPLQIHEQIVFGPNIFDPYSLENVYPNTFRSYLFTFKCHRMIDTFSNAIFPWTDAAYFQGIPRVATLPRSIKGHLFLPYKILQTLAFKNALPEEKTLMACSKHTAQTVEVMTGLHVNVLYPPVSDSFKLCGNISKTNDVVTVTRISKDKSPETIPQIAKMTPKKVTFTIIGSCQAHHEFSTLRLLKECIQKLKVEQKVKLLINVSREVQRQVLQHSKVYLHPLVKHEAFGISAVEAMAAGCIPVAPDVGGLKEVVPRNLRYSSIEEAASLVTQEVENWCIKKVRNSVNLAERFSQTRFREEFLRIMKL